MPVSSITGQNTAALAPIHGGRIADALFPTSRQRMLGILYGQPDRSFLQADLIRAAKIGSGAAQTELANLSHADLIERYTVGRQVFYKANRASPVFAEIEGLVQKTVGIAPVLQQNLALFAHHIHRAFVFGSIAKGSEESTSDIDVLILTEALSYGELYNVLSVASDTLARPVKPLLFTPAEWKARLKAGDAFATRVEQGPKIEVIGSHA